MNRPETTLNEIVATLTPRELAVLRLWFGISVVDDKSEGTDFSPPPSSNSNSGSGSSGVPALATPLKR